MKAETEEPWGITINSESEHVGQWNITSVAPDSKLARIGVKTDWKVSAFGEVEGTDENREACMQILTSRPECTLSFKPVNLFCV